MIECSDRRVFDCEFPGKIFESIGLERLQTGTDFCIDCVELVVGSHTIVLGVDGAGTLFLSLSEIGPRSLREVGRLSSVKA